MARIVQISMSKGVDHACGMRTEKNLYFKDLKLPSLKISINRVTPVEAMPLMLLLACLGSEAKLNEPWILEWLLSSSSVWMIEWDGLQNAS